MTLETIDTSELKKILTLEFDAANVTTNIEQLIKNNARALDGKNRFLRRHAPLLAREKRNGRYFYRLLDVMQFVGDYIEFAKNNKRANYLVPTLRRIHGISLSEILESFDDGFQTIEIAESMTLFTGNMFGVPTNVVVLNGIAYYLTDGLNDNEKQNEK